MLLRLEPTEDAALVDAVLSDPWIADRLRHDGRSPCYLASPAVSYLAAYVGDDLAGVFIAGRIGSYEVEAHVALYRSGTRHGRPLAALFLARAFADPTVLRVSAPVLASLPSSVNFCRRLGFVQEGVKRAACLRDGVPTDLIMFGLTREEWLAGGERIG
jgi:hypothetical protein